MRWRFGNNKWNKNIKYTEVPYEKESLDHYRNCRRCRRGSGAASPTALWRFPQRNRQRTGGKRCRGEQNSCRLLFVVGNGQQMARWIAEETGGELFRIVPEESYGEDYGACADRAKNELDNEIRPALSSHIDADVMAQYDTIYLGFPIWWYDLPTPVWTFLEEYDLSGKTIIPFFSHNGSSSGANSLNRLSELAEGATVLTDEVLSIPGSSVADSEKEVKEWAAKEQK